ncbi:hypothetical protein [Novosphingobium sp. Rr 2-17]|uniref:hypothetical protein n=1 Tax=Novosphingobium sp. Rr 2-17 TaxID=555793 RepID=UPI0005BC6FC1|nr:hypothetical protein [Novosphingobium sp. Rr 2-17]
MDMVIAIWITAAMAGVIAPLWWRSRPILALLATAFVPVIALYASYVAVGRVNDWEGMGGLALLIISSGWILTTVVSGMVVLLIKRWTAARHQRK